jgi:hypothetical protein
VAVTSEFAIMLQHLDLLTGEHKWAGRCHIRRSIPNDRPQALCPKRYCRASLGRWWSQAVRSSGPSSGSDRRHGQGDCKIIVPCVSFNQFWLPGTCPLSSTRQVVGTITWKRRITRTLHYFWCRASSTSWSLLFSASGHLTGNRCGRTVRADYRLVLPREPVNRM